MPGGEFNDDRAFLATGPCNWHGVVQACKSGVGGEALQYVRARCPLCSYPVRQKKSAKACQFGRSSLSTVLGNQSTIPTIGPSPITSVPMVR
ncbi:hypothetical protein quinque_012948 [Culex quinquefasciatus]